MGHYGRDPLTGACGAVLRIDQQCRLAVGDRTPVLHGAGGEVRYGDVVQFWKWVRDAEVVIQIFEQPDGRLQGILSLLHLAAGRPDSVKSAACIPLLYRIEVAHDERKQVSRYNRGLLVPDGLDVRAHLFFGCDRHVGDRGETGGDDQGYIENGLESRLVPAWKAAPGVRGFELGRGQVSLLAVHACVPAPVEASELVVKLAGEPDVQFGRAGLQLALKRKGHRFIRHVVLDVHGGEVDAAFAGDTAGLDDDLDAVEHKPRRP